MTHFIFPLSEEKETKNICMMLSVLLLVPIDKLKVVKHPSSLDELNLTCIGELAWRVATYECGREIEVISIPNEHIDESKYLSQLPNSCMGIISSTVSIMTLIDRATEVLMLNQMEVLTYYVEKTVLKQFSAHISWTNIRTTESRRLKKWLKSTTSPIVDVVKDKGSIARKELSRKAKLVSLTS